MRIGITGLSGSGKTTFCKLLENIENYKIVHVDELINNLYKTDSDLAKYVKIQFPSCIINRKIDKNKLGDIILNNIKKRKNLEDMLFYQEILPLIRQYNNIIIDGITPRFNVHFDIILFGYVDKNRRVRRLTSRGVPNKRIKQIMKVQKDWYKFFKD